MIAMELALLALAALVAAAAGQELPAALRRECPARCVCSTWLNLPAASCTSQGLFSVYAGVPSIVQALDLSNNTVSHLEDRQLSVSTVPPLSLSRLILSPLLLLAPDLESFEVFLVVVAGLDDGIRYL